MSKVVRVDIGDFFALEPIASSLEGKQGSTGLWPGTRTKAGQHDGGQING